jgi:hypothetical protein
VNLIDVRDVDDAFDIGYVAYVGYVDDAQVIVGVIVPGEKRFNGPSGNHPTQFTPTLTETPAREGDECWSVNRHNVNGTGHPSQATTIRTQRPK